VIEVGGTGTLPKSLQSVRSGGLVNLIVSDALWPLAQPWLSFG
jgi:hypothetical protein